MEVDIRKLQRCHQARPYVETAYHSYQILQYSQNDFAASESPSFPPNLTWTTFLLSRQDPVHTYDTYDYRIWGKGDDGNVKQWMKSILWTKALEKPGIEIDKEL